METSQEYKHRGQYFLITGRDTLPKRTIVASSPGEGASLLQEDKKLRKDFGIRTLESATPFEGFESNICLNADFGRGVERVVIAAGLHSADQSFGIGAFAIYGKVG